MYIFLLFIYFIVAVVQLLTGVQLFETPWTTGLQASLSFNISWNLLKFISIASIIPTNHLILCLPFSSCPQSFPALSLFHWISSLHQWPKYWSFSFSNSPSKEYSGFISFRVDWFDLLAVQRILKRLLQHHNSKAILQHSAFFMVQLSYPYMTTGKKKKHNFNYTDLCQKSNVSTF